MLLKMFNRRNNYKSECNIILIEPIEALYNIIEITTNCHNDICLRKWFVLIKMKDGVFNKYWNVIGLKMI
jgi:hypothetical protein